MEYMSLAASITSDNPPYGAGIVCVKMYCQQLITSTTIQITQTKSTFNQQLIAINNI